MPWETPSFPMQPQDTPAVRVVTGARLTRVQRGPLRVARHPDRWLTGAVHNAKGRLVPISQKVGGLGGHRMAPADPRRIKPRRRAPRLRGRWLYGGHWMMHFGHFLTETVTTLWPEGIDPVEGLVFHRYLNPNASVSGWQQRLVDLAGYQGLPIEIVNDRELKVDELVVPSRSIVQHGWGHPGGAAVWRRIAAAVPDGAPPAPFTVWPSRVYLSRTAFNARMRARGRHEPRSTPERDAFLDGLFAEAGFEVVVPEQLSIDDQVRLIRGTRVLAGQAGSALHLAGFAQAGTHILELGDTRMPNRGVGTQRVINTLCGHSTAFIPARWHRDRLVAELCELEVWMSEPTQDDVTG